MRDRIEFVTDLSAIGSLVTRWNDLAAGLPHPFARHEWFSAWWSAFCSDRALAVACAWRNDDLVGVLPLMGSGRRLQAMANVHSPLYEPLARDSQALRALLTSAVDACDELNVGPLPAENPTIGALAEVAHAHLRLVDHRPGPVSPLVETCGSVDEWRAASKQRWGAPLDRFRRKMVRDFDCEFRLVEQPRNLEAELQEGLELEHAGWKGQSGTAILSSAETARFYRDLARATHAAGRLRFSSIRLDGVLVAFDYTLLHADRLYLLKTAFDETHRRLAPGLVMRLSIIEECFRQRLHAYELLGDNDPWKLKFSTAARRHVTVSAYRRRPGPASRYAYWRYARPTLRRVYRRVHSADHRQR